METIETQFNSVAQQYDKQRRKLIPCFQDFYKIAVENINLSSSSPKILDLGAGTGLLSEFVLQKYPNAQITLVDLSEKMLEVAKNRFETNTCIHIIRQDFTKYTSTQPFDAVVSSLAIHHLEDSDKIKLYNSIFSYLKEEGTFINAEQVCGEDDYFSKFYDTRWRYQIENSGLTADEIKASYERIKLDKRSPILSQLKWLKDAGFNHVDCLYKYYDFAVLYAKK